MIRKTLLNQKKNAEILELIYDICNDKLSDEDWKKAFKKLKELVNENTK